MLAVGAASEKDPVEAFNNDPHPSLFADLPQHEQTADNLIKINDPPISTFQLLKEGEQERYLLLSFKSGYDNELTEEYMKNVEFSGEPSAIKGRIAQKFFSADVDNVNSHKGKFQQYYKELHDVDIVMEGEIESHAKDGTIVAEGSDTSINIIEFSDVYEFRVDSNGNLHLTEKNSDESHIVSGDIHHDGKGMRIIEGTIDGMQVKGGHGIEFTDGNIQGKMQAFGGLEVQQPTTFSYDKETNELLLHDAKIVAIDDDTELNIAGSASINDYDDIDGSLHVREGTQFTLNGFRVSTHTQRVQPMRYPGKRDYFSRGDKGSDVSRVQGWLKDEGYLDDDHQQGVYDLDTMQALKKLQGDVYKETGECLGSPSAGGCTPDGLFGQSTESYYSRTLDARESTDGVDLKFGDDGLFSDDHGNYIRFDETITMEGEGFSFGATPKSVIEERDSLDILPSKGFFSKGDHSQDHAQEIRTVQRIVGTSQDGWYGKNTVRMVKEWQREHGLAPTGVFDQSCVDAYLSDVEQSSMVFQPRGGRVELGSDLEEIDVSIQGKADVTVDGETIHSDGRDISRDIGRAILMNVRTPVDIALQDEDGGRIGSFQMSFTEYARPSTRINLGGKDVRLKTNRVYVLTAEQTAFTQAVSPEPDSEALQSLPADVRDEVAQAGHMGLLWVDEEGQPFVVESTWEGVTAKPLQDSHMGDIRDTIQGVYSITSKAGADHLRIIDEARKDDEENIGWFFTDVDGRLGETLSNLQGEDYDKYRSCVGEVVSLLHRGGFTDVTENSKYLPIREHSDAQAKALANYIRKFSPGTSQMKGEDIQRIIQEQIGSETASSFAGRVADWFMGDRSISDTAGDQLGKVFATINSFQSLKSKLGFSPDRFATPPQLVAGNLEVGTFIPTEEMSRDEYQDMGRSLIEAQGHSSIHGWQTAYNNRCRDRDGCDPIAEDGVWGIESWSAYHDECTHTDMEC